MQNIKIGFIGCGKIASFHADVLTHLGVSIVALAARSESEKALVFKEKYNIKNFYTSWEAMVTQETLDALWVIPSWDVIDTMLLPILQTGLPVFFEKPIALSSKKITEAITQFGDLKDKVQIGYNRRFYDFIPVLKERIKTQKLNAVEVHIPENSAGLDDKLKELLFIQNSSHILDLLLYTLDVPSLELHKVFKSYKDGKNNGYNAMLSAPEGIPVHLIANWNVASNFTIRFYFENNLIELKPIEKMSVLQSFEIVEPTENNPIRLYNPKINEQYFIQGENARFKPGFLSQAENFINTCITKKQTNTIACDLTAALNVTTLAENIMHS